MSGLTYTSIVATTALTTHISTNLAEVTGFEPVMTISKTVALGQTRRHPNKNWRRRRESNPPRSDRQSDITIRWTLRHEWIFAEGRPPHSMGHILLLYVSVAVRSDSQYLRWDHPPGIEPAGAFSMYAYTGFLNIYTLSKTWHR